MLEPALTEPFTAWLLEVLPSISSADSTTLAEYIVTLLEREGSEEEIRASCVADLVEFLEAETEPFVNRVFGWLADQRKAKAAPAVRPAAPSSADAQSSPPDADQVKRARAVPSTAPGSAAAAGGKRIEIVRRNGAPSPASAFSGPPSDRRPPLPSAAHGGPPGRYPSPPRDRDRDRDRDRGGDRDRDRDRDRHPSPLRGMAPVPPPPMLVPGMPVPRDYPVPGPYRGGFPPPPHGLPPHAYPGPPLLHPFRLAPAPYPGPPSAGPHPAPGPFARPLQPPGYYGAVPPPPPPPPPPGPSIVPRSSVRTAGFGGQPSLEPLAADASAELAPGVGRKRRPRMEGAETGEEGAEGEEEGVEGEEDEATGRAGGARGGARFLLWLTSIPPELMDSVAVSMHFARFGGLERVQFLRIQPGYTRGRAKLIFVNKASRDAAYASPEAICGNRFIRVQLPRDREHGDHEHGDREHDSAQHDHGPRGGRGHAPMFVPASAGKGGRHGTGAAGVETAGGAASSTAPAVGAGTGAGAGAGAVPLERKRQLLLSLIEERTTSTKKLLAGGAALDEAAKKTALEKVGKLSKLIESTKKEIEVLERALAVAASARAARATAAAAAGTKLAPAGATHDAHQADETAAEPSTEGAGAEEKAPAPAEASAEGGEETSTTATKSHVQTSK